MTLHDFEVKSIDGIEQTLRLFCGQVLLIVNVASRCGFTLQYAGLEELYQRYKDRGFAVLGFPCNQFAHQEPGDEAEIAQFCSTSYNITFPMFAKIEVNGPGAHPLYKFLKEQQKGLLGTQAIKWNFTKFLIGRDGQVIRRYPPTTAPASIAANIEQALA